MSDNNSNDALAFLEALRDNLLKPMTGEICQKIKSLRFWLVIIFLLQLGTIGALWYLFTLLKK